MSSKDLPADDSFKKLQEYVWQMNIDRGFTHEKASDKMVMLMEEAGELAKAIRKTAGMKFTETTQRKDLEEEIADVQIVLLGLAGICKVDLFDAVIAKEKKNRERNWS